ncbi:hypothetical protein M3Y94_00368500 [Aphelenchoides besseyi]|nr:hypothetical protein M3Y94_00368500 [Aphelenchoides besseyi]
MLNEINCRVRAFDRFCCRLIFVYQICFQVNVLFSASSGQTETGSTTTLPPHIHQSTSGQRPQNCGAWYDRYHCGQRIVLHYERHYLLQIHSSDQPRTTPTTRTGAYRSGSRRLPSQTVSSAMIGLIQKTFSAIGHSYTYIFLLGGSAGAGFELFKINFSVNGVSYYKVFKDRQLEKELTKFENDLKKDGRRNSNVCAATERRNVIVLGSFLLSVKSTSSPVNSLVYLSNGVVFLGYLF